MKQTILIISLLLWASAPLAVGRTIYVDDDGPADFNKIQTGKDDAKCNLFGMGGEGKCSL